MTSYAARKFRAVAVHEAAHAVIAYLVDIPFVRAEIFPEIHPTPPDGAALGVVTFDRGRWPYWRIAGTREFDKPRAYNYCARDICMTLAGDLAAALYTGRMPHEVRFELDDQDCIDTIGELLDLSPAVMHNWTAKLWVTTLQILHLPGVWAAVQAVAEELFRRRLLTWNEILPLVDEAIRTAQPVQATSPSRCTRAIQKLAPRLAKRAIMGRPGASRGKQRQA
jgi:hypothetical protein